VQGSLEKISFSGVLRIKKFEKLKNKTVVDIGFSDIGVEVLAFNKAEEELVHNLNMWPGNLQDRLIFLRIESLALRIHWGRDRAKEVLGEHLDNPRIHGLRDDLAVVGHIVKKLVECESLDLLGLHVAAGIVEVEYDIALLNLLHKQILSPIRSHFVETGKLLKLAMGRNIKS